MKMFGEITRTKYKWHPAKELCTRFNVPNPYSESSIVGVPELQKRVKTSENFSIMNLELQTTSSERKRREDESIKISHDSRLPPSQHKDKDGQKAVTVSFLCFVHFSSFFDLEFANRKQRRLFESRTISD